MKLKLLLTLTIIYALALAPVASLAQATLPLSQSNIVTMAAYQQDTDPALNLSHPQGVVRAGKLWIDTSNGGWVWKRRNALNTAWITIPASATTSASITDFNSAVGGIFATKTLNDLFDVNTSGVSPGQVLKYNGSAWIPSTDATGGGEGGTALSDLSDVLVGSPSAGQVLKYNGSVWIPDAENTGGSAVETIVSTETELNTAIATALTNPTNYYTFLLSGNVPISASARTSTASLSAGSTGIDTSFGNLTSADVGSSVEILNAGFNNAAIITTITAVLNSNSFTVDRKMPYTESGNTIQFIKTIPKNVTLRQVNGGKFTQTANGTSMSIDGEIDAPRALLFSGFEFGNLRLAGATREYYPEWFGAKGDAKSDSSALSLLSGTDDYYAIQLMLDSVENTTTANGATLYSGTFSFAPGRLYRSNSSIKVRKAVRLLGSGGGGEGANTGIWFATGIEGLIFHSALSEHSSEITYSSDRSVIDGLAIYTDYTPLAYTHTLNITPRAINSGAPDMFSDVTVTAGEALTDPGTNGIRTVPGTIVKADDGTIYTIKRPSGNNLEIDPITSTSFVLQSVPVLGNFVRSTLRFNTPYQNSTWIGGKLKINGSVFTIAGRDSSGLILSSTVYDVANSATYNAADVFSGDLNGEEAFYQPPAQTGRTAIVANKSGLVVYSRINITNSAVRNFSGDGALFSGSAVAINGVNGLGYVSNNNYSSVRETLFRNLIGSGTHTYGRNANNISFHNNDSSNNAGYGYLDYSDLGGNYYGNHASSTFLGNYRTLAGGVNQSNFYGNYGEVSIVPSFLGQGASWIGGNEGSEPAFSKYSEGYIQRGGVQGAFDASLPMRGTNSQARQLGNAYEQPAITSIFGASSNPLPTFFKLTASNDNSGGYQMDYGVGSDGLNGWYTFRNYQNGSGKRTGIADVMWAVSGNGASEGGRKMLFPNGFSVGMSTVRTTMTTDVNGLTIDKQVKVSNGDVYVSDNTKGIILKSLDGTCYRYTAANGGALNTGVSVTCPAQ